MYHETTREMAVKSAIDWDEVFGTECGYMLSLLLNKTTVKSIDKLGNTIIYADCLKNPLTVPKHLVDKWRQQEWL